MKHGTLLIFLSLMFSTLSQVNKKVLIIGIDGCRPDALALASTPNIDSLKGNGLFSADALNDDITISGPGWSSILCGVESDKHLVTNNNFAGNNYSSYPSLFKRIEDYNSNLHTVSFCHWDPINDDIIQDDADFKLNFGSDADLSSTASDYLLINDPDVLFLHFDDVDHAGHSFGFSPNVPEYISSIEGIDAYVGEVVQSIENRPTYAQENWLIVVTTDHGGVGTSHGGTSIEHRQIFMIASGDYIANSVITKDSTYVSYNNCLTDSASLTFVGNNSFVQVPDATNLNFGSTQDFTVECRVRTNNAGDVAIVGNKDWNSGTNKGFVFSFVMPSQPNWKVNIGDGSSRVDIEGGAINDNEWHMLSASFDRDGYLKIYEDGILLDSLDISGIADINTNQGLFFGTDINNSYDFTGAIQEVRVWNGLIEGQAVQDYSCLLIDNSHPNFSDLIGYWKLDEGTGGTALDYSSSVNNGTINGAIWNDIDSNVVYNYDNTPRQMDVSSTVFTHLCIPIDANWELDGSTLIQEDCLSVGGVDLNPNQFIKIYPNPASDYIGIKSSGELREVSIIDVNGRIVIYLDDFELQTIDISEIPDGLYNLLVSTEFGLHRTKFVKN